MPALLLACFVVSGAISLILQVVWVRQLVHVFGSSTLAISTVLATFMAGLAVGAWTGGRIADRLARARSRLADPLLGYAVCEATVGVSALLVPLAVAQFHGANAWLWTHLSAAPGLLAVARCAIAAAVLTIPTVCMGATLPLLTRRVTEHSDDLAALAPRVGVLYAANTAGAVVGAASAGFWLIPGWGLRQTNTLAGGLALTLAATIALATRLRRRLSGPASASSVAAASADQPPGARFWQGRVAAAAFALSGAVAMALEVLWSRALALIIGSSVYSFTLVLVVFLIGIASGSWLIRNMAARSRFPLGLLAALFAGAAAAIAATIPITDALPELFLALLATTSLSIAAVLWVHTSLIGLLILPTALCLGAIMPVVVRICCGSLDAVGRDVGRAYAANTVGAICGALLGGFAVLPAIGLENGVRGAAVVNAALALGLAAAAPGRPAARVPGARRNTALITGLAIAAATVAVTAPRWDTSTLTAGIFRMSVAKHHLNAGGIVNRPVIYYVDGVATTVTVEQGTGPILKNNGKVEASTKHDMPTQILLGLLPVLLHDAAQQDVFVIGYGSGITVGAIAESPAVARIDVAELEPEVYRAADRFFGPYNHHPERNRRVRRLVGDGRNVLLAGGHSYDVIVSEPSNPWIAGVATLFTREFYRAAKRHLNEDGIFAQWAQLYELGPRNIKMIYKTFHAEFPYVYAFSPAPHSSDTFLLGSRRPLPIDLPRLDAAIRRQPVNAELGRAGVSSAEDLLAKLLLAPDEVASFSAGGEVNTDDNALLEHTAPRDLLNATSGRAGMSAAVYGQSWPYGRLDPWIQSWGPLSTRPAREVALARALLEHGRRREAGRWLQSARDRGAPELDVHQLEVLRALTRPRDPGDPELPVASPSDPILEPAPELFSLSGAGGGDEAAPAAARLRDVYGLVAAGRWQDAWHAGRDLPPRADSPGGHDVTLLLGYVAFKSLHLAQAKKLLAPLANDPAYAHRRPAALYYAGRATYGLGRFRQGIALLAAFAAAAPELARQQTAPD
jgi:spermidine synthase